MSGVAREMISFFGRERVTPLDSVPERGAVHIIGVAGIAMAQLAVELVRRGYTVSGSDQSFYEPSGSLLRGSSVKLFEGYSPENIPDKCDLVVIGNSASASNKEVQEIERRSLPFSLFPQLLFETVINERRSLVVSGTHGKSTSTALAAFLLNESGMDPSFFIGGRVDQLTSSLKRGEGRFSVVEGDEYDSAFFAKLPKFHFYRPNVLLITSIEFDHADIYPDERAIEREFENLIESMGSEGIVVACSSGGDIVRGIVERYRTAGSPRILTYGFDERDDYRIGRLPEQGGGGQKITVSHQSAQYSFSLRLGGLYNALNAGGVLALLSEAGVSVDSLLPHFGDFRGVARRQQIVVDTPDIRVIEDFAHHPTAVRLTLEGLREEYPNQRIVALFEPRSNTSRRAIFQERYAEAFDAADVVIVCEVTKRAIDDGVALLDTDKLLSDINLRGKKGLVAASPAEVFERFLEEHQSGDIVAVMSNGGFGDIIARFRENFGGAFKER
jgi:UDP-N-acetylmuramate: L-alanyl-gamma-D-glutamyl-meso-diaminopimelate ligase